jgi:hypothetical protein
MGYLAKFIIVSLQEAEKRNEKERSTTEENEELRAECIYASVNFHSQH